MFSKLARLRKRYRRHPDSPVFARLADMHLHEGNVKEALALCEEGCRRFPYYVTGFQVLSKCYRAQGKLEEARSAMDRALRLEPDNPGGYVQLASIYRDLGISTLALKSLQQAASLDPLNRGLSQQIDQENYQVRVESTQDPVEEWNPDAELPPVGSRPVEVEDESPDQGDEKVAAVAYEPVVEVKFPQNDVEEPVVAAEYASEEQVEEGEAETLGVIEVEGAEAEELDLRGEIVEVNLGEETEQEVEEAPALDDESREVQPETVEVLGEAETEGDEPFGEVVLDVEEAPGEVEEAEE